MGTDRSVQGTTRSGRSGLAGGVRSKREGKKMWGRRRTSSANLGGRSAARKEKGGCQYLQKGRPSFKKTVPQKKLLQEKKAKEIRPKKLTKRETTERDS